jgi:zinc protease
MRAILLVLLAAAPLGAQRPAPHTAPLRGVPLPVDTAVHVGHLANGLRYLVRHNGYPAHRLELRLIVRAGSILEDSSQRGLAHFIEHMGFNGTTHFGKNDLVKYLQSIGVRYGADLNANTSFDETTYILPVPSDKPELVDRAFEILHDWASGDQFDSMQVVGERGVIMGEWRNGLGASTRELNQEIPILLQGSRYARRLPIGDTGVIMHATPAPLRRFYHDWYRPDLMGVIAVGDYPVDSLVALIRSNFGALRNPAPERPRTDAPIPLIPGTRVAIITDSEETNESVEMLIRRPTVYHRTEADERRDLSNALANSIVGQRMSELARKPDAPFVAADFGPGGFLRDLQVYQVDVDAKTGRSAAAFAAVLGEVRRLQQHGVLPAELDRAKASLLRAEQDAAEETGKTESGDFVASYTDAFLHGNALMSAEQRYRLAQRFLPTITVTGIDSLFREGASGRDRFVAVVAPAKVSATLPTRDSILAILASTDTMTTTPWTETTVSGALVPHPPAPGRIVAETTYADLGITDWRLSNGARVLIKPTDFKADQVLIAGEAAGGLSLVPDNELIDGSFAGSLVQVSGAGNFDAPSLRKKLAGKIVGVSPQIDETSEGFDISTAPADLASALQVFWLTATQPRLDSGAVRAFLSQVRTVIANRSDNPEAVIGDTIQVTLGQHGARAQPLTPALLDTFNPDQAMAIYRNWFGSFGDFTFVIVGNVQVDSLRPLVAQWLASLPARGATRTWKDVEPLPPDSVVTKVVHKGKEPVAMQVSIYSGPADSTGPMIDIAANAAAEILQNRLLDTLREAMGATYGVNAESVVERVPRLRYRSEILFKSAPGQSDTLWQAAQRIIAGLQATGPTADELQKYVAQARRETEVAVKTNDWWMSEISSHVDPDGGAAGRPLDQMLHWSAELDAVTLDQVREAARRYFDPHRVAHFVLLPGP